ncbi:MAG: hypothetical protein U0531_21240 [Dehalococcoidia bacterium]
MPARLSLARLLGALALSAIVALSSALVAPFPIDVLGQSAPRPDSEIPAAASGFCGGATIVNQSAQTALCRAQGSELVVAAAAGAVIDVTGAPCVPARGAGAEMPNVQVCAVAAGAGRRSPSRQLALLCRSPPPARARRRCGPPRPRPAGRRATRRARISSVPRLAPDPAPHRHGVADTPAMTAPGAAAGAIILLAFALGLRLERPGNPRPIPTPAHIR